jgi:drug/metabolite transporter (DMT)-like permease
MGFSLGETTMSNEHNDTLTLVTYSEDWFSRLNLSRTLVRRVLVIAIVSGLAAAVIDLILDLPVNNLAVSASGLIAVLNGAAYASLKHTADRTGLYMGILTGWLAYMIWYFALHIAGVDSDPLAALDWFEALVTGLAAGAFGFACWAVAQRVMQRQA